MSRRYYRSTGSRMLSTVDFENVVAENMRDKAKALKRRASMFFAGIFICFFSFAGFGFLASFTGGLTVILIPLVMVGFVVCGILSGTTTAKYQAARQMVSLMDQIEACDRIAVDDLIMPFAGSREIAYAVALLMRHGNLAEYELIANKLVAKKSLHLSAEDITEEGDVVVRKKEPEVVKCPSCGGNPGDSNYCPYCGCRLK